MRKILTLISLFAIATISLQAQGISFYKGTWEEALAEAKKQDKIIFLRLLKDS